MTTKSPEVTVVIVNYNTGDLLRQCLLTTLAAREALEVLVVDNCSTDSSLRLPDELESRISLLINERNEGFARAVNLAVSNAKGRYILLLNPDAQGVSDFITPLVLLLDEQGGAGVVGGKVLNADGSFEPACMRAIPTPLSALIRLSGLSRFLPSLRTRYPYNLTYDDTDDPRSVEAVSGSFCMFSKETGQAVPFDERFFLYGEDLDFCLRVSKTGAPVRFLPTATVMHRKGVSMRQRPIASTYHFYNSMLLFHKKHYAAGCSTFFNLVVFIGVWALALPKIIVQLTKGLVRPATASHGAWRRRGLR